jgi:hypothetical protein
VAYVIGAEPPAGAAKSVLQTVHGALGPEQQEQFKVELTEYGEDCIRSFLARDSGSPSAVAKAAAARLPGFGAAGPSMIVKAAGAGGRDQVRVSKKKARKAGRCGCGTRLRAGDKNCRGCGAMTTKGLAAVVAREARKTLKAAMRASGPATGTLSVSKSAGAGPAFVSKSARKFAAKTAGMVQCPGGHLNRPGGNCCSTCAQPMPGVRVPPLSAVTKSAFANEFWKRELGSSPDPGMRELYRQALWGQNGGA